MTQQYTALWKKTIAKRQIITVTKYRNFSNKLKLFGSAFLCCCNEDLPQDVFATAPVRQWDYWCFSHIYSGKGKLCLPSMNKIINLSAGNVVIIAPGTPSIFGGIVGSNYQEDYIFFDGSIFSKMADANLLQEGCFPFFHSRCLPEIAALIARNTPASHQRAVLKMQDLLFKLNEAKNDRKSDNYSFERLLKELNATPQKWWNIDTMADYCSCSSRRLRKLFLEKTGELPKDYIDRIKMNYAAEQLIRSNVSISQLCVDLNFRDRSHFSRRFKVVMGTSPGHYRDVFLREHGLDSDGSCSSNENPATEAE